MRIYQNSVQLIGLGSAGTNIVEAFLKSKRTMELLHNDITRLSLMAIDIADPEIRSLQETYNQISKSMIKAGIPKERLQLIAQSVKFPTAEAMFDFINQKYNEYLVKELSTGHNQKVHKRIQRTSTFINNHSNRDRYIRIRRRHRKWCILRLH
jgi:hypothetical protein